MLNGILLVLRETGEAAVNAERCPWIKYRKIQNKTKMAKAIEDAVLGC